MVQAVPPPRRKETIRVHGGECRWKHCGNMDGNTAGTLEEKIERNGVAARG